MMMLEQYQLCPKNFEDIGLTGVDMHLFDGGWFESTSFSGSYLGDSDLPNIDMSYSPMTGAIPISAAFSGNDMYLSDFAALDLAGADFIDAELADVYQGWILGIIRPVLMESHLTITTDSVFINPTLL